MTLPAAAGEGSFSILPPLKGEPGAKPTHPAVVHQAAGGTLAVREGTWKLVQLADGPHLYDLSTGVGERTDVANGNVAVVQRLTAALEKLIADRPSTPGEPQQNDVPVPLFPPGPAKRQPPRLTCLRGLRPLPLRIHAQRVVFLRAAALAMARPPRNRA